MNDSGVFIRKLYNKFFISTVISVLLKNSAYFLCSFLAGNLLGPTALGTVGLLVPFSFFYIALGTLYEVGCAALCSKYVGDNDFTSAKKVVTAAFVSNLLICAFIAVFGVLFLDNILMALGIPAETFADARTYALVFMLCGFFVSSVSIGYALLKFDGYLKTLSAITVISPLCAVAVTYALIKGAGAGLGAIAAGTCSGYVIISLIVLYLTAKKAKVLGFTKIKVKELGGICLKIVKNGLTGATGEICSIINGVIINTLLITRYGELALSGFTAYCALFSLYVAATLGSSLAFVQLAGVMNAERDSTGVKRVVSISIVRGLILAALVGIGNLVFTEQISRGFGMGSAEAMAVMRPVMLALSLCAVFDIFTNTFIYLHNTLGRHMVSTVLVACRRLGFLLIPAFTLSGIIGVAGIWHSLWLCSALTSAAAVLYSFIASRRNPYLTKPFLIDTESEKNGSLLSLSVDNSVDKIVDCSRNISTFCEQNLIDALRANLIALSMEEMLLLMREHSLKDREEAMNVRVLCYKGDVVMRIRGRGDAFNPLGFYKQLKLSGKMTLEDALERQEFLGLKMVVDTVKSADYHQTFGVNNLAITI